MIGSCFHAAQIIERRASGLTEAERLVLEQHLATCAQCREDSAMMARFVELSESAASGARSSVPRERLIARAFLRAEQERTETAATARPAASPAPSAESSSADSPFGTWRVVLRRATRPNLALAAVVMLLAMVAMLRPRLGRHPAAPVGPGLAQNDATVISGAVSMGDRTLAPGSAVPDGAVLVVAPATELALAHARVIVSESTTLAWNEAETSLELEMGAVDVSVDPRPKRPFSVKTRRFRVEVLGTEFHVDATSVRVSRGFVRVRDDRGGVLAELHAGESFELARADLAGDGLARNELARDGNGADAGAASSDTPRAPGRQPDPAERLATARRALANGEVAAARREIANALSQHPRDQEQAEAHMLLGDAARIAGNLDLAASEYLGVFEKFRSLPLADTALFSAARVEAKAGHDSLAQQHLAQYVAQFPHGQFRKEALERMAAPSEKR